MTWQNHLLMGRNSPRSVLANALIALNHAPEWRGVIKRDEFRNETMMQSPAPWENNSNFEPRGWKDVDDAKLTEWLNHQNINLQPANVHIAVETVAYENSYHPIKNYLKNLKWDGKPRTEKFLSYYGGSELTPYSSAIGKAFLISAVARIYAPGCKADCMPIFEGEQGIGKSTLVRLMAEAPGKGYYDELSEDFGTKDSFMSIRGVWICEVGELDAMNRVEANRVKLFLSKTVDRYRPPFGRRIIQQPRSCIFIGTTNRKVYLKDETGGRRFWPVKMASIDLDAIMRDRDQIWAEAVHLYRTGNPWYIVDDEILEQVKQEQKSRYEADIWTDDVARFVSGFSTMTIEQILTDCLKVERNQMDRAKQMRVSAILKNIGWESVVKWIDGRSVRRYVRKA